MRPISLVRSFPRKLFRRAEILRRDRGRSVRFGSVRFDWISRERGKGENEGQVGDSFVCLSTRTCHGGDSFVTRHDEELPARWRGLDGLNGRIVRISFLRGRRFSPSLLVIGSLTTSIRALSRPERVLTMVRYRGVRSCSDGTIAGVARGGAQAAAWGMKRGSGARFLPPLFSPSVPKDFHGDSKNLIERQSNFFR